MIKNGLRFIVELLNKLSTLRPSKMKIQTIFFFAQIIKHIPRLEFNNIVQKHQADRFSKRFTAWDQLIAMLWCQFSGVESLREIEIGLESDVGRLQHINARPMARSTLAYANEKRSYKVFEELSTV